MADDHGLFVAQRRDQPDDVIDDFDLIIGVDGFGFVALAIAAHVGRDDMIARRRERGELVTPAVPAFGKAVEQQHQRTFAGFGDVELDAVGGDAAFGNPGPAHAAAPSSAAGTMRPRASFE